MSAPKFDPALVEQAETRTLVAGEIRDVLAEMTDLSAGDRNRVAWAIYEAVAPILRAEGAAERTRLENVVAEQNTTIDLLNHDLRRCAEHNEALREELASEERAAWQSGDVAVLTEGATGLAYADGYTWRYAEGVGSVSPLTADAPRTARWADIKPVLERAYQRGKVEGAREVRAAVEESYPLPNRVDIDREGTCDGCAENKPLVASYPEPDAEPWLCAECDAEMRAPITAAREALARIEGGAA